MRNEFKLEDPGEGVHEVEINEILVAEGDEVSEGDDVFVVESDKAAIDLPTPHSGRVVEIRVSEGDVAEVGDVLMVVEDDKDDAAAADAAGSKDAQPETGQQTASAERRSDGAGDDEGDQSGTDGDAQGGDQESAARERSADRDGSDDGPSARAKSEESGAPDAPARGDRRGTGDGKTGGKGPVRAAPAARKLAKEKGVDLWDVEPSGRAGEIRPEDVRAAVEDADTAETRQQTRDGAAETAAAGDDFGPVERVKLRSIRAATARAMTRSWAEIPHALHQDEVDITDLELWRRGLETAEDETPPTLTAVAVKAAAALLRRHPRFNARLEAEAGEIELCRYYNINVAVATDRGLLTPVLRAADRKPLRQVADELAELGDRVRNGRPGKQDLTGGTFTITNVGPLGGTAFAPIINPPQSAILGLGRARLRPVVEGDVEEIDRLTPRIRLMLPVAVAFDHRLIDGADAAHFVNDFGVLMESVDSFAFET